MPVKALYCPLLHSDRAAFRNKTKLGDGGITVMSKYRKIPINVLYTIKFQLVNMFFYYFLFQGLSMGKKMMVRHRDQTPTAIWSHSSLDSVVHTRHRLSCRTVDPSYQVLSPDTKADCGQPQGHGAYKHHLVQH